MKKYLSKSDIISHMRCPLKMWLEINKSEVVTNDSNSPMIINGNAAGAKAREQFPNGIMVNWKNKDEAIKETKKLMADKNIHTLYEATFLFDNTLIRADIMTRNQNSWHLYEVKSTTKLTHKHYEDIAIQKYIIEHSDVTLNKSTLMFINKEFIYNGNNNYDDLFKFEDIENDDLQSDIIMAIESAHVVVNGDEPIEQLAPRCKQDYICGCKKYCDALAPYDHISFLPRGGTVQKKLAEKGLNRISEITNELGKSKIHQKVLKVTLSGEEEYISGASLIIADLPYPHHYLDFESIQFSVPYWIGVKTWRQVPFQWSDHVHYKNGERGYEKFIDVTGNDPRREFAEKLVKQCGHDDGAVLVYNKAFERMIMEHLKIDFPDLEEPLESIRERCFDLLPLMQAHYYHPEMKGSWSIKKVLNCFVPDMDYGKLEDIHNGLEAQIAYFNLIDPYWEGDKVKLKENSLEYCKYDTLSMVKIVENINKRANNHKQS